MNCINPQFLQTAQFQKKINDNLTQCLTCERKCKISEGKTGFCNTRINQNGIIYTIVYGLIPALSFNPIEKKPLYHFYPGTIALTVGTYGCNFNCFWCQNHHISHPRNDIIELVKESNEYLSPEKIIEIALKNNCQGTSISFNEPTLLFEYALKVFELAKKERLYNTFVSNGYMTEDVLRELVKKGLDAINIDVKGGVDMVKKHCGINVDIVWRNSKLAKKLGVHVEITTLIIEGLNSNKKTIEEIAKTILNELGEFTPFHLSKFFPQFKSSEYGYTKPTSLKTLIDAYDIAKNAGLKYVYLGNLPHSQYEHTFCPQCSKMVIKRRAMGIDKIILDSKGFCKLCGFPIVVLSNR